MSMFLDLNSVLVKFWKEQGDPSKEVRIQLLNKMIHWYEHEGTVILDSNVIDPEKDRIDALEDNTQELAFAKDLSELIDYLNKRYPEVSFAKLCRIVIAVDKWEKNQCKK